MSNKTLKFISVITIIFCVIMAMTTCFAIDPTDISGSGDDITGISTIGNRIATFIRNVGVVVAVIILMVLGIKYMLGSAEEKAEYKKTMMPYVIGAVLIFGAAGIAQVIVNFSNSVSSDVTSSTVSVIKLAMNSFKLL